MATLVLTAAAQAIAGAFTLSAFATAALATAASVAGYFIDQALFSPTITNTVEGQRLDEVRFQTSSEGSPIARTYGRIRIKGNVIWATRFREEVIKTTTSSGGKGGGGKQKTTTIEYNYYCSFAIGLCEGEIIDVGRMWADGREVDLTDITYRVYNGSESQGKDAKIVAVEGDDVTPAYRGLAYVVFEEVFLEQFGNRIPNLNIEVLKTDPDSKIEYEDYISAVTMIPASGEFAYGTTEVVTIVSEGDESKPENKHTMNGKVNFTSSIDFLQKVATNIDSVGMVCAWHGDDLRIGQCTLKPKVESLNKATKPYNWFCGGIARHQAERVETFVDPIDGIEKVYLGGALSDRSVFEAIQDFNARGIKVMFYPFILMDIAPSNSLPNPYSDNAAAIGQSAFPWRGRITLDVDREYVGTSNKTASARTQVNNFFGTAVPGNFGTWNGNTIPYSGPSEWSFRRMILHYAKLCAAAGGVDSFIIGSEMVRMNQIQDNTLAFPAVDNFVSLAADVKSIVGAGTKVSYAADWSEFTNYRPSDGSNDLYFHLDPIWSSANIDFIGIDNYMPLSDWRDGSGHLDAANYNSIYDLDYLKSQIEGGELYDYFYASYADRQDQIRTPVTDGSGEPWVFRFKDLNNWWSNTHHNRPGGVRSGSSTAWVPESKQIWFTELGCPAIDKGSNQPNVFVDPKSSESFTPYFSNGGRDDLMQRQFNTAQLQYWHPSAGNNPLSGTYSHRMINNDRIFLWTWDSRPWPWFPVREDVWSDGENWQLGHWLTGRLGLVTLKDFVKNESEIFGLDVDATDLKGLVIGYNVEKNASAREIITPLMSIHSFDGFESEGKIKFKHRGDAVTLMLEEDDLVDSEDSDDALQGPFKLVRGQESEIPNQVTVKFVNDDLSYKVSSMLAQRQIGNSLRVAESSFNIVMGSDKAQQVADTLLVDAWVMRERAEFRLSPALLAMDPADVIELTANDRLFEMRIESIGYEYDRPTTTTQTDPNVFLRSAGPRVRTQRPETFVVGIPTAVFMDLPMLTSGDIDYAFWLVASATPWPGGISFYRSPTMANYVFDTEMSIPGLLGTTTVDFYSGSEYTWDNANTLDVALTGVGTLQSLDEESVLLGGNTGAVYNETANEWEIIQWVTADLIGANTYRLSKLLRGRRGSEHAMADPLPSASRFVVLDEAIVQSAISTAHLNLLLNWTYGPANKIPGDLEFTDQAFTARGIGRRPYSPDHLVAERQFPSNDVVLTWKRRTRLDGEWLDGSDVPLNEESEKYEIDIYDNAGTTVVRTVTTTTPTYTYTAANETSDFGSAQPDIDFEVFQISASFGRGSGRRRVLALET